MGVASHSHSCCRSPANIKQFRELISCESIKKEEQRVLNLKSVTWKHSAIKPSLLPPQTSHNLSLPSFWTSSCLSAGHWQRGLFSPIPGASSPPPRVARLPPGEGGHYPPRFFCSSSCSSGFGSPSFGQPHLGAACMSPHC